MSLHLLVVLSRISRGMERVNELLLVGKGEKGKNKRDGKLIVLLVGEGGCHFEIIHTHCFLFWRVFTVYRRLNYVCFASDSVMFLQPMLATRLEKSWVRVKV